MARHDGRVRGRCPGKQLHPFDNADTGPDGHHQYASYRYAGRADYDSSDDHPHGNPHGEREPFAAPFVGDVHGE